ncbi:conserved protein of unknown function [Tenacibaculum sp. 190130A14a]|uniref:Anti-sigma factor n=1 Tax=Tenacibaculum polynesiense TaxID=3137857 RepID=A0ABP1F3V7_9FLAO
MEDKLHTYFSENDFDILEPHSGHIDRFQRKLEQQQKNTKKTSWRWLSVAASVILLLGFYLGSIQKTETFDLTTVSPKMAEAESFFVSTINQELKEIEKYRTIETEVLIEDTLDQIEELEEQYKAFIIDLKSNENKKQIIKGIIANYQQRLTLLEELLSQLENNENPNNFEINYDEVI